MEAQPELKKLISKLKKEGEKPSKSKKKKTKTMKAMGGGMAMKKKGYAHGGAMKRTGHMDMRKGGLFK